ncbi:hypothetical protein DQ238_07755 [Geodermatophilus sp. TF02-6]|uniref:DUF4253 domain-containing protein n=1 Tax=Geodermatophilus sp. TF02-6 TaxID=2250575 RepID=UPI000DEB6A43|nr:DUF4253 domain-containing protein [Geodermatophilus sp. TF02-6]RBY80922.1 hypothetical protein DQ238_07755 [Geodermatophilus sp. TF02-6]
MTWVLDEQARSVPVRAEQTGSVSAADQQWGLPELVPVVGTSPKGIPDGVVRGWLTAEPVADPHGAWRRWARRFDRSGFWPLMTSTVPDRPFLSGELLLPAPPADAAAVLRRRWEGMRPVRADGTLLPHPPWSGLAVGVGEPPAAGVVLPRLPGGDHPRRLILVPARRPADTLAQLGWHGACNWFLTGADVAGVLRSWEDRFGAYVVAVGFAELDLVVTRPPQDAEQSRVLAHEHIAFCPDNFSPQDSFDAAPLDPEEYAARLHTAQVWHFWWD